MKSWILAAFLLGIWACQGEKKADSPPPSAQAKPAPDVDSHPDTLTSPKNSIKPPKRPPRPDPHADSLRSSLQSFLRMPLDFPAFKKIKGGSNSTIGKSIVPLYKPDTTGFYYSYLLFPPPKGEKGGYSMENLVVYVYYYGTEPGYWEENNEELVGITCRKYDRDLGEANLVRLHENSITKAWGEPTYQEDSDWAYIDGNHLLYLDFSSRRVRSWKYYRLRPGTDWKAYWDHIKRQSEL